MVVSMFVCHSLCLGVPRYSGPTLSHISGDTLESEPGDVLEALGFPTADCSAHTDCLSCMSVNTGMFTLCGWCVQGDQATCVSGGKDGPTDSDTVCTAYEAHDTQAQGNVCCVDSYDDCSTCLSSGACVFYSESGRCIHESMPGGELAEYDQRWLDISIASLLHRDSSADTVRGRDPIGEDVPFTTPADCCVTHASCTQCAAHAECRWCLAGDGMCTHPDSTHFTCSGGEGAMTQTCCEGSSCASCYSSSGSLVPSSPPCVWCNSTQECVYGPGSDVISDVSDITCPDPLMLGPDYCANSCYVDHSSCDTCTKAQGCIWMDDVMWTGTSVPPDTDSFCDRGGVSGPESRVISYGPASQLVYDPDTYCYFTCAVSGETLMMCLWGLGALFLLSLCVCHTVYKHNQRRKYRMIVQQSESDLHSFEYAAQQEYDVMILQAMPDHTETRGTMVQRVGGRSDEGSQPESDTPCSPIVDKGMSRSVSIRERLSQMVRVGRREKGGERGKTERRTQSETMPLLSLSASDSSPSDPPRGVGRESSVSVTDSESGGRTDSGGSPSDVTSVSLSLSSPSKGREMGLDSLYQREAGSDCTRAAGVGSVALSRHERNERLQVLMNQETERESREVRERQRLRLEQERADALTAKAEREREMRRVMERMAAVAVPWED
ncbi:hypothetical protein KIPB_004445 [Kipferlia bialata]|uniref:PSI domain-containing protein n=1 Tax=Kipferlia bialata TaxID=797122 RepID=A0A9K3CW08_9EUKA|nr:hypothetical protein KIPB_004445 [Kipferlia bialata]|eukprot:g4445.t1